MLFSFLHVRSCSLHDPVHARWLSPCPSDDIFKATRERLVKLQDEYPVLRPHVSACRRMLESPCHDRWSRFAACCYRFGRLRKTWWQITPTKWGVETLCHSCIALRMHRRYVFESSRCRVPFQVCALLPARKYESRPCSPFASDLCR